MKITDIGYFGQDTNVIDAPLSAADVDAFAAAIASLPPRRRAVEPSSRRIITLTIIAGGPANDR